MPLRMGGPKNFASQGRIFLFISQGSGRSRRTNRRRRFIANASLIIKSPFFTVTVLGMLHANVWCDVPSQPKHEQQAAIVAQNKLSPEIEALVKKVLDDPGKTKGSALISTGQIAAMSVPNGWVAREAVTLPAGAGLIEYHPVGHDDIRLNSFYRGRRISAEAAQAFKDCLAQSPHALQSAELKALSEVLRDKSYDFEIIFARTEDLNGRRVLSVEGTYKDPARTKSRTIYVDSDHTGSAVQEISYTANSKDYQGHLTEAETALKSIIWR